MRGAPREVIRSGLGASHEDPLSLQYSFSLTTFSPSGKLVQIEYALNAVAAGATSLGISATDGVVIATEKKLPSMLVDESTVQKITVLSPNIGMVYSGMGPDYRVLVRKARKTAQTYFRLYQEHIPVAQLVREVAAVMQEFTREFYAGTCVWVCMLAWMEHGPLPAGAERSCELVLVASLAKPGLGRTWAVKSGCGTCT